MSRGGAVGDGALTLFFEGRGSPSPIERRLGLLLITGRVGGSLPCSAFLPCAPSLFLFLPTRTNPNPHLCAPPRSILHRLRQRYTSHSCAIVGVHSCFIQPPHSLDALVAYGHDIGRHLKKAPHHSLHHGQPRPAPSLGLVFSLITSRLGRLFPTFLQSL